MQTSFISVIILLNYNSNCFTILQVKVWINKGRNNKIASLFNVKSAINTFFALIV